MMSVDVIKELILSSQLFTSIDRNCSSDEDLNLDSLSMIWLILELETRFELDIDYRTVDLAHFKSIKAIHDYVRRSLR